MLSAKRKDLRQLLEIYALRTRRLSEAVAILGAHVSTEMQIDEIMAEVQKMRRLAEEAGTELFAFVGQRPAESPKD